MVANNHYNNNMVVHSKDSAAISILLLLKVLMDIDYHEILYKKHITKYYTKISLNISYTIYNINL